MYTASVVGEVVAVADHPNGDRIWLAAVDLGDGHPVQIVFGGRYKVRPGELVAVAPPGARYEVPSNGDPSPRTKKVRARRYRGQRSHGMLCSLDELGWLAGGPDEVAILRELKAGDSLDGFPPERYAEHVVGWERAVETALGSMVDEVLDPAPAKGEPAGASSV